MHVANCGAKAKLNDDAEHASRDIRAVRVVADIFREFFFAAVWGNETRPDGDPWRGRPSERLYYLLVRGLAQVTFGIPVAPVWRTFARSGASIAK